MIIERDMFFYEREQIYKLQNLLLENLNLEEYVNKFDFFSEKANLFFMLPIDVEDGYVKKPFEHDF